jgi:hypothetical protein
MKEVKTHWKKFYNYEYIGTQDLPGGRDIILTIRAIQKEMVTGEGGRKEECQIIRFKEHEKGMILNRTNAKTIQAIYNTPYIEDWTGKQIQIFVKQGIKFGGNVTDGLRIRPDAPRFLVKKTKIEVLYDDVVAAFRSYNGEDKATIGATMNEKKKAGEMTELFLTNTLKSLTNEA